MYHSGGFAKYDIIENYNFENFGDKYGNKNGNGKLDDKTEIPATISKPNIENGPRDNNLSTTSSLSKNSSGSRISTSNNKRKNNPYSS